MAKIDLRNRGMITCNNPAMLPKLYEALAALNEKREAYHKTLMDIGVKAYRVNDGWVDRENKIATFHDSEKDIGHYYGRIDLMPGDKIFIGCMDLGGFIAEIVSVEKNTIFSSAYYHYKELEKFNPITNGKEQ